MDQVTGALFGMNRVSARSEKAIHAADAAT